MGSVTGARKVAARRIGITIAEYESHLANGERWCTQDKTWHPIAEFGVDLNRSDGLARSCLAGRRQHYAETYTSTPRPNPGRRYVASRDDDRIQARRRINHLVDIGLIPKPNALDCTDCGHSWIPDGKRHEYDHHLGYAPDHHEDVEPVCTTCHHRREVIRKKAVA